jgi:hypothetical protein
LADLDDAAVGVPQVAAQLGAVVVERRSQELRALSSPLLVDGMDVGDTEIEEGVEAVRVVVQIEDDVGLVRRRTAPDVDHDPDVGELHKGRRARSHHLTTEDLAVEAGRGLDVPGDDEVGGLYARGGQGEIRSLHCDARGSTQSAVHS